MFDEYSDEACGLHVEQIAAEAWRVSEGGHTPLPQLLGFIEQRPTGFEVMQLGDAFDWSLHETLRAALLHMKGAAADSLDRRFTSDLNWIV